MSSPQLCFLWCQECANRNTVKAMFHASSVALLPAAGRPRWPVGNGPQQGRLLSAVHDCRVKAQNAVYQVRNSSSVNSSSSPSSNSSRDTSSSAGADASADGTPSVSSSASESASAGRLSTIFFAWLLMSILSSCLAVLAASSSSDAGPALSSASASEASKSPRRAASNNDLHQTCSMPG